jgi:hypothetical protein
MIPVIIPAMRDASRPERTESLAALLEQLSAYPWADVYVHEHENTWTDMSASLAMVAHLAPWVIYIEDDVYLGARFEEIRGDIETIGADPIIGAINFFGVNKHIPGIEMTNPGRKLIYIQCTAIRTAPFRQWSFAKYEAKFYGLRLSAGLYAPDWIMGEFLRECGYRHVIRYPSLVQHRHITSTAVPVNDVRPPIWSPTFAG